MRRSSLSARLITIVIAVVVAPVALGVLATGGSPWLFGVFRYAGTGIDLADFAGPILLQAAGIAMLVVVVLTGIWSSAGLIAVGVLSIVPVVLALAPATLLSVYRAPLPREWLDGLSYGVPLLLMPVLGMMGVVLAVVRRRPEPRGAALGAVGVVLAPLLLAGGGWLVMWGVGRGMLFAMQQFRFDIVPEALGATVGGLLLLLAGIGVTRWSPFALLLPAVALIALTVVAVFPSAGLSLYGMLPRESASSLPAVLILGAGVAAAVIYLAFTVTLLRVRSRSRAVGVGGMPPSGAYPPPGSGAYPPPGSGAYPPPGSGVPPQGGFPAQGGYPTQGGYPAQGTLPPPPA